MGEPLRYRISDWDQLKVCQSNNSKNFRITVSKFIQNDCVKGTLISVFHTSFGVLFSSLINRSGDILDADVPEMSTAAILEQLRCFGFLVEFPEKSHLPESQLAYLNTLKGLQYDKLRVCSYTCPIDHKVIHAVTAFKIDKLSSWILNTFQPSYAEYIEAVVSGAAFNLNNVTATNSFRWDWLDFVADINDILEDNNYHPNEEAVHDGL